MSRAKEARLSQTLEVLRGGAGLTVHQVGAAVGVKRGAAAGYLLELERLGYARRERVAVSTADGFRDGDVWYADGNQ